MKFNYITGEDTKRYKFIRVPQVFFEEKILGYSNYRKAVMVHI